ncbi:hypothetical protein [Pseudokineococcus sp. 1T1Z-3]|uniref:hypothetical protein n=1 Tax=Pseudokineococcus sp. 1T1Z-3 TaxID=3132745 RepID=UPI0030AB5381
MTARAGEAGTGGVLRIELRRSGAYLLGGLLAVLGAVLVVTSQAPLDPYGLWSSSWAAAMRVLSETSIVLGPLAAAGAAWTAGREGRRHLGELLATTPRPVLARQQTTWAAIALGVVAGTLGVAGVLVAGIAPGLSYSGGRWPLALLLAVLGVLACSAVGFAAGRLIRGRLVAPGVGVLLYVLNGYLGYLTGPSARLSPLALVSQLPSQEGYELDGWSAAGAAIWLLAVTATAVLLAGSRRLAALVPALLAAVSAAALVTTPATGDSPLWLQPDEQALEQVCTDDAPQVCVQRVHAGLLQDVTPPARELLARVQDFLPVDRIAEVPYGQQAPPGTLAMADLQGRSRFLRPGMDHPGQVVDDTVSRLTSYMCEGPELDAAGQQPYLTLDVAHALLTGELLLSSADPTAVEALITRLEEDPAAARAWMARFLPAAADCDVATLVDLARP